MPSDEMASCECGHVLRDHAHRERKPCLICEDCPMFLWSGNFVLPASDEAI
jgi:hypothetical protein